jgi:hypothetical protein
MARELRDLLRRLHRTSGPVHTIAEHLRQLAQDLDKLIDAHWPRRGGQANPPDRASSRWAT